MFRFDPADANDAHFPAFAFQQQQPVGVIFSGYYCSMPEISLVVCQHLTSWQTLITEVLSAKPARDNKADMVLTCKEYSLPSPLSYLFVYLFWPEL